MHKFILTIFISLTVFNSAKSQETVKFPKLKLFIDSLYQVDQQVQQDFLDAFQRGATMDSIKFYEDLKTKTFIRHTPIIKKIIKEYGYPTVDKVGTESSSNFFPLIQHSDNDINFQSKMLPLIKKQVDKKLIEGWEYAYLYDRKKINIGKEQLYGTQLTYDNDGNAIPKKLKDKENVNKRRQELGMGTLEKYLANATETHKKMNQKN